MSTLQDRAVSRAGELSRSDPYYRLVTAEKLKFLEAYQRASEAIDEINSTKKNSLAKKTDCSSEDKEKYVSDILKPLRESAQKLWLRLDQTEKAHKNDPKLVAELQRVKSNVMAREASLRADAFEKSGNHRGQLEETDRVLMYSLLKENVGQKNLLQLFNNKGAGFAKEYDGITGKETTSLFKFTTTQLEGLTDIDADKFAIAYARLNDEKRKQLIGSLTTSIDLSLNNSSDPSKANKRVDLLETLVKKEREIFGPGVNSELQAAECVVSLTRAATLQKAGAAMAAHELSKQAMATAENLMRTGDRNRGLELMFSAAQSSISSLSDLAFEDRSVLKIISSLVSKVENTVKNSREAILSLKENGTETYRYFRENCANLRAMEGSANVMAFNVDNLQTKLIPEFVAEYGKEFPAKVAGLQNVIKEFSYGDGLWGQVLAGSRNALSAVTRQEKLDMAVALAISIAVGMIEGATAGTAVAGPEGTVGGALAGGAAAGTAAATSRFAGRAVLGAAFRVMMRNKAWVASSAYLLSVSGYKNRSMIADGFSAGVSPNRGSVSLAADFAGLL